MPSEVIAIAADHAGFGLKQELAELLTGKGFEVLDLGTNGPDSVDYPDFAEKMAEAIREGRAGRGILVCGTGIGIGIAANRFPGIRAATCTDATMAPPGHTALYVLVPVSHQHPNIDWSKQRDRYRQVALRQLAKVGVTDLERRIRFERVVTPVEWENTVGIYRGATFNLAHNLGQMLHLRPQNRFEEFDRMYLVGGGTHPGSGLPVIFESARISARLLLEDLGQTS